MKTIKHLIVITICVLTAFSCKDATKKNSKGHIEEVGPTNNKTVIPKNVLDSLINNPPKGLVWIPQGTFLQGAVPQDKMAMQHEKPQHKVTVDGFFMDITEITNAQFSEFVNETGYVTVAEHKIDWEEMKVQLPEGTPKPHDSIMQPGSLVFKKSKTSISNLYDVSQWWKWQIGANWKHPNGPESSIEGKDNYPVVHITYKDAQAYCKWAKKRLPTEAEWEYAARGGKANTIFYWGDAPAVLSQKANSWEGEFPVKNTLEDGFESTAPVKSYPPNGFGLFDMAGNVWELTADLYNINYYNHLATKDKISMNPKGANKAYNPNNPYIKERVIKGGSFLCSDSYCASYRASARMGNTTDSSAEHIGFRTVVTPKMLLGD
ncbi:formylglycine-generating enzyme family protein [uncultured Winogradskyella sp.]|uniref:formylglycine-generating enzyme family protein n=1 Tax=uncultured Winogradskyella sp. TaxID=395353 RepID=UPI0026238E22|nr:formylglycine-generating enzyme family protein [uncultured Winogradskyella sp.]